MYVLFIGFILLLCISSISSSISGGGYYFSKKPEKTNAPIPKSEDVTFRLIYNPSTKNYLFGDGTRVYWSKEKNADQIWSYKSGQIIHSDSQKCLTHNLALLNCDPNLSSQKWNVTTTHIKSTTNQCISAENDVEVRMRQCEPPEKNDIYQIWQWERP